MQLKPSWSMACQGLSNLNILMMLQKHHCSLAICSELGSVVKSFRIAHARVQANTKGLATLSDIDGGIGQQKKTYCRIRLMCLLQSSPKLPNLLCRRAPWFCYRANQLQRSRATEHGSRLIPAVSLQGQKTLTHLGNQFCEKTIHHTHRALTRRDK